MKLTTKVIIGLVIFFSAAVPVRCEVKSVVRLDSLDLSRVGTAGDYTSRLKPGMCAKDGGKNPITIAGKIYKSGVGVMAHSIIYVKLNKSTEKFSAIVGVDDSAGQQIFSEKAKGAKDLTLNVDNSIVKFRILGDGRELYNSGEMKKGDAAKSINIGVKDIDTLILLALPRGEATLGRFADWADAKFIGCSKKPEIIVRPAEKAELLTPPAPAEPRINGPKVFGVRPGSPFLFKIPATGEQPMVFDVKNLPKGLTVDETTGQITGMLQKRGEYKTIFVVSNARAAAEREFKIVVGDTIALTPPMGWNSWYVYRANVDDIKMRTAADIMVKTGMINYGYSYISIDDSWEAYPAIDDEIYANIYESWTSKDQLKTYTEKLIKKRGIKNKSDIKDYMLPRDANGMIRANSRFPDMKAMTGYIHSLGLKAGIYSSPGPRTCQVAAGSYKYEKQDALQYALWGFDFLKYDWCSYSLVEEMPRTVKTIQKPFKVMAEALKEQKRDIVYNVGVYGQGNCWEWPDEIKGNCWRTDRDLGATVNEHSMYVNFITIGGGHNSLGKYAEPGHWNDPDYILIGRHDKGSFNLTPNETYSYMSLWSLLSVPLIYSGDMTKLDDFLLNVLCNNEIIAVNLDPLGRQGYRVDWTDDGQVWVKELEDGSKAVGLFNTTEYSAKLSVKFEQLGIKGMQRARDLWRQKDIGNFEKSFEVEVPSHGVSMIQFSPILSK